LTGGGGAALIVIDSAFVADWPAESAARAVKLDVPAALGIPLISPVADKLSPAGRVPADTVQL
jgi:hypothetical protein